MLCEQLASIPFHSHSEVQTQTEDKNKTRSWRPLENNIPFLKLLKANICCFPYVKAENMSKDNIHIPKEAEKINTSKACPQFG